MSPRRSWLAAVCLGGSVFLLSACGPGDTIAAPAPVAAPSDVVMVTRVVDGDTFQVADGRTVRVLGIDSCESGTDAGRDATGAAVLALTARSVTLTAEPGADRDPYGRVLRYVQLPDGSDFGKSMVPFPHTAVYPGGDASPTYLAELRALDTDGRTCDRPEPAPTTTQTPAPPVTYQDDDDHRPYVPVPDNSRPSGSDSNSNSDDNNDTGKKPRTGHSGHPCLPGERDGDGDGYCGEGRH